MPGCLTIVCSHQRAWEYYAESVYPGNEDNFLAKRCGSLHSYDINACMGKEVPMGYAATNNIKGNFFLRTNGKSPFGKSSKTESSTAESEVNDDTSTTESTTEKPSTTTEESKRGGFLTKNTKLFG